MGYSIVCQVVIFANIKIFLIYYFTKAFDYCSFNFCDKNDYSTTYLCSFQELVKMLWLPLASRTLSYIALDFIWIITSSSLAFSCSIINLYFQSYFIFTPFRKQITNKFCLQSYNYLLKTVIILWNMCDMIIWIKIRPQLHAGFATTKRSLAITVINIQ